MCPNGIIEQGEQCDDNNMENLDGCDDQCNSTGILAYVDFLDQKAAPDWFDTLATANMDPLQSVAPIPNFTVDGVNVSAGGYLGYGASTIPDVNKGSLEIVVASEELKAQQNFYLFDAQVANNSGVFDERIRLYRNVAGLDFRIEKTTGVDYLLARIPDANINNLPVNTIITIRATWDTQNLNNKADRARLEIFQGGNPLTSAENGEDNKPNLIGNALNDYNLFLGSQVNGASGHYNGDIRSFMLRK